MIILTDAKQKTDASLSLKSPSNVGGVSSDKYELCIAAAFLMAEALCVLPK